MSIFVQVVVAHAEALESLAVTNWPNEMVAGGMAFDDSWLPAIIEANPLPNIRLLSQAPPVPCLHPAHLFILFTMSREFTLRMDSDHYVEEGFLTKTSLSHLLNHAVHNCPRLEKVVGEWTKVGLVSTAAKDFSPLDRFRCRTGK